MSKTPYSYCLIFVDKLSGSVWAPSTLGIARNTWKFTTDNDPYGLVHLRGELGIMMNQWFFTPGSYDGQVSGVLADWLEEHPECIPDFEVRDPLIGWLRARFLSEKHNVSHRA